MKKSIILVVIIIAIGIACFWYFHVKSGQNTAQNSTSDAVKDSFDKTPLTLVPQNVSLQNGISFTLQVAKGFTVTPAFEGLKRVRFMAKSPDERLFVTDMYDLSDNTKGKVYILDGWNPQTKKFTNITTYLENLRNPNNVAFYTEGAKTWLYIALTDKLVRYQYKAGDDSPSQAPETLATFPDYGLSYKYGGWHLTRTVAFHNDKLYVSVGSSCDSCEEKLSEPMRASILEMNPDGSDSKVYANGLRNAVGIKWVGNDFFATAMGSDKLGNDAPQDTFQYITGGRNYGWPYCYEQDRQILEYNAQPWQQKNIECSTAPLSYEPLGAHSAPLGFDYFGNASDIALHNYFLVALHGSSILSIGRGYQIARVQQRFGPEPFITGFLQGNNRYGRPADVLFNGDNSFFFTDDFGGVIYYVFK
ncbi:MAG: glucose/sorbosone dehydrogenase [Candidatus Staskawiczbacteria bacterium]|nr:glucose/sorbosone dehydrogenase [Candidatus Staskawiczbacteria bacterium]